ncbi:MAG: UbiX family flavin prenyltransferase [Magnetococcus sp. DMHC-8]
MHSRRLITVAWTGASGARYGLRLVHALLVLQQRVDLLISDAARLVLRQECDLSLQGDGAVVVHALGHYFHAQGQPVDLSGLRHFAKDDWLAPMASGGAGSRSMVVCPCSMGTLAAIAHGLSDNLIERAADVIIKEGRPLILVPRETPFSVIHLENMLSLARLGVTVLPAAPGFYHRPERLDDVLDFIVARILDHLGIAHTFAPVWPPKG